MKSLRSYSPRAMQALLFTFSPSLRWIKQLVRQGHASCFSGCIPSVSALNGMQTARGTSTTDAQP